MRIPKNLAFEPQRARLQSLAATLSETHNRPRDVRSSVTIMVLLSVACAQAEGTKDLLIQDSPFKNALTMQRMLTWMRPALHILEMIQPTP